MKRTTIGLAMGALLLGTTAFAQTDKVPHASHGTLNIGAVAQRMDYTEWDGAAATSGIPLDTEKGTLAGAALEFSWTHGIYAEARFSRVSGNTDYVGYLVDITDGSRMPYRGQSNQTVTRVDARLGYAATIGSNWTLTPYASYTDRSWNRKLLRPNHTGYMEQYAHTGAGLGLRTAWTRNRLTLALDLGATRIASAKLRVSQLLDLDPFTVALNTGTGPRHPTVENIALTAIVALSGPHRLTLSARHREFDYGRSHALDDPTSGLRIVEPASSSLMNAFTVGYTYAF